MKLLLLTGKLCQITAESIEDKTWDDHMHKKTEPSNRNLGATIHVNM